MAQPTRNTSKIRLSVMVTYVVALSVGLCGCSHYETTSAFENANDLFSRGAYGLSLQKYEQIIEKDPAAADRAFFEMGIIQGHPNNSQKDYRKASESFAHVIKDYPESPYRKDSEMMTFYIDTVIGKDRTIAAQQTVIVAQQEKIQALQQDVERQKKEMENRIRELQGKIEELERKRLAVALGKGIADKILIEKKARRLTLMSRGEVLKTYKVALGGNPDGPKERQGDNKTPEGKYVIDSRNNDSRYHLSLHISYPNERDRKRAKQLGVRPGGNIMIHGIKNGFSWVGDLQARNDWTNGCIAVTDEEIEEIAKAAPNGTMVEIRP